MNSNPLRRCWAEIDYSVLPNNVAALRKLIGNDNVAIMAVIKADAYGHGILEVAQALKDHVQWFGVANVSEALRIQQELPDAGKILILSPLTPDEIETAIANGFSCSVSSLDEVRMYQSNAARLGIRCRLHAVADTGMGRMGVGPQEWPELVSAVQAQENCLLEGMCSHFPNADEDRPFTLRQIELFQQLISPFAESAQNTTYHIANSAGIIDFSDQIDAATLVRAGLALYGVSPECQNEIVLQPALTWKSRVTLVRSIPEGTTISYGSTFTAASSMKVATIAAGYGDGYPRNLSGKQARVLIGGRSCPLAGRVTMDQIVVDVSHLAEVKAGDEVVLMGSQGDQQIDSWELARRADTIPWEIFTGITARVERVKV